MPRLSLSAVSAVYVYKGDPFQPGPLEVDTVTFNTDSDGIPKRTEGMAERTSLRRESDIFFFQF